MKYLQNDIEYNFKLDDSKDFVASINYQNLEIEFIINSNYFDFEFSDSTKFDVERVKIFTDHVIKNIDYLTRKSRIWTKILYDGIGNNLQQNGRFEKEEGYFSDIIVFTLVEINRGNKNIFYYDAMAFYSSKSGWDMDCYHSYNARFRHIGIDYPCFEGIMRSYG